jgi:hypothetical protein
VASMSLLSISTNSAVAHGGESNSETSTD